jgi:hypothetical protein
MYNCGKCCSKAKARGRPWSCSWPAKAISLLKEAAEPGSELAKQRLKELRG